MRYVKLEIPSDEQVVNALQKLLASGQPKVTALMLCDELVKVHSKRADCQLAIARAEERGHIQFNDDWTLCVPTRKAA